MSFVFVACWSDSAFPSDHWDIVLWMNWYNQFLAFSRTVVAQCSLRASAFFPFVNQDFKLIIILIKPILMFLHLSSQQLICCFIGYSLQHLLSLFYIGLFTASVIHVLIHLLLKILTALRVFYLFTFNLDISFPLLVFLHFLTLNTSFPRTMLWVVAQLEH